VDSAILFTGNGTPFIVDEEDVSNVLRYNWCPRKGRNTTYIQRGIWIKDECRQASENLHHFVFKLPGDGYVIDHINGDGSYNRKSNLQEISNGDNIGKQHRVKKNCLGVQGVYSVGDRFRARISIKNVSYNLGVFDTASDASDAYQKAKKNRRIQVC
jgi:hypothetical protein